MSFASINMCIREICIKVKRIKIENATADKPQCNRTVFVLQQQINLHIQYNHGKKRIKMVVFLYTKQVIWLAGTAKNGNLTA